MIPPLVRLTLLTIPALLLCGCTHPAGGTKPMATQPLPGRTATTGTTPAAGGASTSVSGRFIAVICDADVTATSMFDNQLNAAGDAKDVLTVLPLPLADSPDHTKPWATRVGQAAVSNSVFGPPTSLAVTPDGRMAYVASGLGQRKAGMTGLKELPSESCVTVVDLQDPSKPQVLNIIDLPGKPISLDVNPQGDLVAVAVNAKGHELTLLDRTAAKGEAAPLSWPLVGMENIKADIGTIAWHPTGRYLAVTLPARGEVVFFEFTRKRGDGRPGIAPWGSAVKVGSWPLSGRFTPDGRSYVVACTDWDGGAGFTDRMRPGSLKLIRLSNVPTAISRSEKPSLIPVEHTVAASLPTGVSPESLAVSPDGSTIAVGTWEGTVFPEGDKRYTSTGGLATFAYTPGSYGLKPLASEPVAGMPGGIAFDATGEHLVVSLFKGLDAKAQTGEVAVYRVVRGAKPALLTGAENLSVGLGPHSIVIVK